MNFGIFIRSIGERTERLCAESCYQCLPPENVHLLRNYYPSYNVYRAMFREALERGYDRYMGLDADVILMPGWLETVNGRIRQIEDRTDVFKFTCKLHDRFLPHPVDRGNHVYDARFTELALKALEKNIRLSRLGPLARLVGVNPGFYLKPETAIRTRFRDEHEIQNLMFDDIVGWHAFEQSYEHIFHSFTIRANRNPDYETKYTFLSADAADRLRQDGDMDRLVANLGWQYGKENPAYAVDARRCRKYRKLLFEEYGIQEKLPIHHLSLHHFLAVMKENKPSEMPCD